MTCSSCGTVLAADQIFCPRCGVRATEHSASANGAPTGTAELLGRAVGAGYEVGEMIGRGGFGEVFAAIDRSLKRVVAIKVLRADIADSRTAIDRFRREAEALSRLRHPHIMPVFGIGEGEGLTYFVMPRIEGESVADLLARGESLPLAEACRVIAEAADALAAAHRAGIVHRDIKPDNILLEGPERHALLMDFGIAKSGGADSRLTGTGMIIGTPLYMSPEQASGDHTGPASDLYSLGVVAYELLSGRPLFGAALSPQQVVTAHLTVTPDDPRTVNPRIPASVARSVMRCLQKDPADRWPSVDEFVRRFNAARADLPREPDIIIPEEPPPLSARGRRLVFAAGVFGLIATVAATATFRPTLDAPRMARTQALAQAEKVLGALALPRYRDSAWRLRRQPTPTAFLGKERTINANAPSLSRLALGEWQFAFYTAGTAGHVEIALGGPGWVSSFTRVLDSATARATATDTSMAVPLGTLLRTMGWDPDSMRVLDSTRSVVDGRPSRTYRWVPKQVFIAGRDTIERQVQMTLSGGLLSSYRSTQRPSATLRALDERRSSRFSIMMSALIVAGLVVLVTSVVAAHRRRTLRWERALRMALSPAVLIALVPLIEMNWRLNAGVFGHSFAADQRDLGSVLLSLAREAPVSVIFFFAILTPCVLLFAAAEPLVGMKAPRVLAGVQLLVTRPRLRSVVTSLPVGTALGFGIAGAASCTAWALTQLGVPPALATQSQTLPASEALASIVTIVGASVVTASAGALLLLRLRALDSLNGAWYGALVTGAGFALLVTVGEVSPSAMTIAQAGLLSAGVVFIIATRGIIDASVAFVASFLALGTAEAWQAPHSEPWPFTCALVVLVVSALAGSAVARRVQSTDGAVSPG